MATAALLEDDVELRDDEIESPPEPQLPERYEVVNGRIVETSFMSRYATKVANRLNRAVLLYLNQHDIGDADIEVLYHIPQPEDEGRNRRPDWSFVSYERWPKDQPYPFSDNAGDVVPDIAAEVVSPGDKADDLIAKVREYLRGGVRLVWIVYPLAREIHAYRPGSATVQVHFADADLDAPDVLPGFRVPVGPLFPPTEPPTHPA